MAAETALLAQVPLFERLNEEERALLAQQLDVVQLAPGEVVFRRGEPGNAIYVVAEGQVEIFVEDTTGQRIVFETVKAGDFFGELSLLDGDPRSASAVALQPTRALRLDRADLELLFTRYPSAALDVLAVIGRRLREADRLLGTRPMVNPNQALAERETTLMKLADLATTFSGSFSFLAVHLLWFAAWVAVNQGYFPALQPFDPYPFGLLTMVVSLEAIFLSCMVLISQNRQAAKDRMRSDVEYDANIRAGLEVTHLHVKVDSLYEQVLARLATLEKAAGASSVGKGPTAPGAALAPQPTQPPEPPAAASR